MELMIDESTITQAAQGDIASFEAIYRATAGFVYNVALGITRSAHDAEEASQNVFLKVYRNLIAYQPGTSFKAWLYRIIHNESINFGKKRARIQQREDNSVPLDTMRIAPELDNVIELEHHQSVLGKILDSLSPHQKECIVLREIHGFQYDEIASILDININTVRSRLKRAREQMMVAGKQLHEGLSHEM
ncbi:MAG: RNA polymerase sigma factor [Candidatus Auribacterota bacterium]